MATSLGSRIRELRDKLDLSLREFAAKLDGISAAHLSDIELGRRYPSDALLKKMAAVLKVSVVELKTYDNRPPVEELRRLTLEDPAFGLALRTLVDKDVSPDDILRLTRHKRNRGKT